MFWRIIYIAYNVEQQHHRNLVAGNKQYCYNNLHIHTDSRSVCYNSNNDGNSEPTNNADIYSSSSDMFWRFIYFTCNLEQQYHRNMVTSN